MQTIYVSADFPLNRRMRKAVQRGKLHVVRDGGERSGLGGGMSIEARRAVRTHSSPLVCMADGGGEVGGGDAGNHAWTVIDNPGGNHPDVDILREADRTLAEAEALRVDSSINPHFARHLGRYERTLFDVAKLLLGRRHPVAFIGEVGVGKTSMICGLTGMQMPGKDGKQKSALITGPGGTTVCEVEINRGYGENRYALNVESRDEKEIKAYVADWCEYLAHISSSESSPESSAQSKGDKSSVPKEIDRAIRNMSGLSETRVPQTRTRVDPAKDLAAQIADLKQLEEEVLRRMNLPRRQRTEIAGVGMEWLRKCFADINDGKHPDFSIPGRITVSVPRHPFGDEEQSCGLEISIVDTKGVDETAAREDLQRHFDDPHAIVVLCSGFTSAPAPSAQLILERARDGGVRDIDGKASILVLPHGNEATDKQRDDEDINVEEAYEEKGESVKASIFSLGVGNVPIQFYNVENEDAGNIRAFFISRIEELRQHHRGRLEEIIKTVRSEMDNREKHEFLAQKAAAAKRLAVWIDAHEIAPADEKIHAELLTEMRAIRWASSLRASVARRGRWYNFDYYGILGLGARKIANERTKRWMDDFRVVAESIEIDDDLSEAHGFAREVKQWLFDAHGELLRNIGEKSADAFENALESAAAVNQLWLPAQGEWGRGPGYKIRVVGHNQTWFGHEIAAKAARHLDERFLDGWRAILKQLGERLSVENSAPDDIQHEPEERQPTMSATAPEITQRHNAGHAASAAKAAFEALRATQRQEVICQAIQEGRAIQFQYKGQPARVVEPHQVGCRHNSVEEELSAYQTGGHSESGDTIPGWRTFKLNGIGDIKVTPDTFMPRHEEGYCPGPNKIFADIICEV